MMARNQNFIIPTSTDSLLMGLDVYKNKNTLNQKRFKDGCYFMLNTIIVQNFRIKDSEGFKPVELNSRILIDVVGFNYKEYIDALKTVGLLSGGGSYISTGLADKYGLEMHSKRYNLTPEAQKEKFLTTEILLDETIQKIRKSKAKRIAVFKNDPIFKDLLNNLTQVEYVGGEITKDWKSPKQKYIYTESYKWLKRSKRNNKKDFFNDDFFFFVVGKTGRAYNTITNLPKDYRKKLRHKDGSKLSSVDLRQASPLFLMLEYCKETGDLTYLNHFLINDWYKLISGYAYKFGFEELSDLYEDDRTEFKKKILKDAFFTPDYNQESLQIIKAVYPAFAEWLDNQKQKDKNTLVHLGQNKESGIFVYDFSKLFKGFWASIHDEILCKKRDTEKVINTLSQVITEKYNFIQINQIKKQFKVSDNE